MKIFAVFLLAHYALAPNSAAAAERERRGAERRGAERRGAERNGAERGALAGAAAKRAKALTAAPGLSPLRGRTQRGGAAMAAKGPPAAALNEPAKSKEAASAQNKTAKGKAPQSRAAAPPAAAQNKTAKGEKAQKESQTLAAAALKNSAALKGAPKALQPQTSKARRRSFGSLGAAARLSGARGAKPSFSYQAGFQHIFGRQEMKTAEGLSPLSRKATQKQLSLNGSIAYSHRIGYVGDSSFDGLSDASLSLSLSHPPLLPTGVFAKSWSGEAGVTLPTAAKTRKRGRLFSLFGSASHTLKEGRIFSLSASHTLYLSLARWNKDIRGHSSNPLAASSHSLQGSLQAGRMSASVAGQLFFMAFLRNKGQRSFLERLNAREGSQGFQISLAYSHPKPRLQLFFSISNRVSFISPVLSGFQLLDPKYVYHTAGLRWRI